MTPYLFNIIKSNYKSWIKRLMVNSYNELPSEYQEVKYLETDGRCYIDTNLILNQTVKLDVKFRTPETIATNVSTTLFYSGSGSNLFGYAITSSAASGKYRAFYKTSYTSTAPLEALTDYILKFDKEKFYLDNVLTYTFSKTTFTLSYSLPLFAQYYNAKSPINYAGSGTRIYYCNIYKNNKIERKFVPCYRKSDNEAGFYDLVYNEFYTNNGSGEFSVGDDV